MNPLISIVITSYNYDAFLKETIDSALSQTYSDKEVIVVDDGSNDNSPNIIKDYGKSIIPILKENKGQASSFNAGFAASRGEIIFFLDSDDILCPTAIERVVKLFEEPGVSKVHWLLEKVDSCGRKTGNIVPEYALADGNLFDDLLEGGPDKCGGPPYSPPTSGNAWSRSFLEKVFPIPEEEYRTNTDYYLFLLAPLFGKIRSIGEVLGYYRVHGKNYSLIPLEQYVEENVSRFERSRETLMGYARRKGVDFNPDKWTRKSWYHRLAAAIEDISSVTPQNDPFILVDDNQWGTGDTLAGRPRLPFINNNELYWGAPTEDIIAIGELEREREQGASAIVFAWTSFWWLDYYTTFQKYLKANYERVLENENVVIFTLKKRLELKPFETGGNSQEISTKEVRENQWLINKNFKTILDVGANEGQFAGKMRKLFSTSQIHSFEPIPQVYNRLLENFKNDSEFFGYNYALGDKDEEAQIYLNEYSPSSSLLQMGDEHKKHFDFAKKESACNVVIKRLDDVMQIESLPKPVLLKIDVQGFEEQVIQGGKMFIKGCDMIMIEVSFTELYDKQPLFHSIYQLLFSLGFKYSGNYEQLISPEDGSILQADAIFIK